MFLEKTSFSQKRLSISLHKLLWQQWMLSPWSAFLLVSQQECWSPVGICSLHLPWTPVLLTQPHLWEAVLAAEGWLFLVHLLWGTEMISSFQNRGVKLWPPSQHSEHRVAASEVIRQALPTCNLEHTPLWPLHLNFCWASVSQHWIKSQNPATLPLGASSPTQLQESHTASFSWGFCYWQTNKCCRNSFWLPSLTCSVFCKLLLCRNYII